MNFSNNLFWDTDVNRLDYERNSRAIIERVAERGRQSDWFEILKYYGIDRIRKEVVQARCFEPKTLAFLSGVLEIPIEDFRCYNTQEFSQERSIY